MQLKPQRFSTTKISFFSFRKCFLHGGSRIALNNGKSLLESSRESVVRGRGGDTERGKLNHNPPSKAYSSSASSDGSSAFAQAMKQKQKQGANSEKPPEESGKDTAADAGEKSGQDNSSSASSISKTIPILLGVLASYIALGQLHESQTDPSLIPENEDLFSRHNRLCKEALVESYEYFMNPPTKKLLPPLPPQMARDHTLCIELTDSLTHLVWDVDVGWRVALRPGVKKLLYTLHQYFELVVFTNTPSHLASPVIDALDNFGLFHYRLFREHHRLVGDKYLKDLSFLNRDLSKVIVVDTNQESLSSHPENGLLIKKWTGEADDKVLYDYTAFLQELLVFATTQKIDDLRPILSTLRNLDSNDLPKAWATHKDNLKTLIKQRAPSPSTAQAGAGQEGNSLVSLVTSTLGALFAPSSLSKSNSSSSFMSSTTTAIDKIEQYCADTRLLLNKELESHEKEVVSRKAEQREMIEKQIAEIKNSDLKLIDYLMGNVPPPGGSAAAPSTSTSSL